MNETIVGNPIDIETSMADKVLGLKLSQAHKAQNLISIASHLLDSLAKGLSNSNYKFREPYDSMGQAPSLA